MDLINGMFTNAANQIKEKLLNEIEKNGGFIVLKNISACLTGLPPLDAVLRKV